MGFLEQLVPPEDFGEFKEYVRQFTTALAIKRDNDFIQCMKEWKEEINRPMTDDEIDAMEE